MIFVLLAVTACSVGDVRLKHPSSGDIVVCAGGERLTGREADRLVVTQRGCIEDFKAQGSQRIQ